MSGHLVTSCLGTCKCSICILRQASLASRPISFNNSMSVHKFLIKIKTKQQKSYTVWCSFYYMQFWQLNPVYIQWSATRMRTGNFQHDRLCTHAALSSWRRSRWPNRLRAPSRPCCYSCSGLSSLHSLSALCQISCLQSWERINMNNINDFSGCFICFEINKCASITMIIVIFLLKLVRTNLNYRVVGVRTAAISLSNEHSLFAPIYLGWTSCLISFVWGQSTCQERVESDKIQNEKSCP